MTSILTKAFTLAIFLGTAKAQENAAKQSLPQDDGLFALSVDCGTLGAGASAWVSAGKYFTFNAGYNWLNIRPSVSTTDIDYSGKLDMKNIPVMANWHPFKGTFRIFSGAVFADSKIKMTARANNDSSYSINGHRYTTSQIGVLAGEAKFENDIAPIVGLGWSKSPKKKGLGAYLDLGVAFSGSAKVNLSASGPISSDPTFQADLAREVKKVNDEIEFVKFYPIIRAGIMYRF